MSRKSTAPPRLCLPRTLRSVERRRKRRRANIIVGLGLITTRPDALNAAQHPGGKGSGSTETPVLVLATRIGAHQSTRFEVGFRPVR